MDWLKRIAELEQAEREAMAQFNYVTGRLTEARELYAMVGEEPPLPYRRTDGRQSRKTKPNAQGVHPHQA
jgi:hypothetical protein